MDALGHFVYENFGWFATFVFTLSFFFKTELSLLRMQLAGASLWIIYGFMVGAYPVVVANVLVAGASIFKQIRLWRASRSAASPLMMSKAA